MSGNDGGDGVSRRQAIAATVKATAAAVAAGGGFALCMQPVHAATITTDAGGLDVADVKIPTGAGDIPAYRAYPAKGKAFPLVLVVHEIFGVHEHIRDVCRRLAKQGYFALAPDLFSRHGDPSKLADIGEVRKLVAKAPDAQVLSDLDAAYGWAKTTTRADAKKLAITGFCWGGRITWLYAAHQPALRAGVAWYGRLVGDKEPPRPRHPADVAGELQAPVLGLYGADDQGIPVATVDQMKKALTAGSSAAKKSEIVVYPGAGHAFLADYRPSYNPQAAEDGWKRMLAWLKKNGVR
jgi:carboxymethylenebutenolidase